MGAQCSAYAPLHLSAVLLAYCVASQGSMQQQQFVGMNTHSVVKGVSNIKTGSRYSGIHWKLIIICVVCSRMLSNRESARRSRRRKQAHVADLEKMVEDLKQENTRMTDYSVATTKRNKNLEEKNRMLEEDIMRLKHDIAHIQSTSHTKDIENLHANENHLETFLEGTAPNCSHRMQSLHSVFWKTFLG